MNAMIEILPEQIHVWINTFISNEDQDNRYNAFLSAEETQRANIFMFSQDRERYRHAHIRLRRILSCYTGLPPEGIRFEAGVYGKPYLKSDPAICFSLSHTKEIHTVAVSLKKNVGIDVEKPERVEDMEAVARQFMSREEYKILQTLTDKHKETFFYRCWVIKESLAKASGRGIGDFLRDFSGINELDFEAVHTLITHFDQVSEPWWFKTFEPLDGYVGAICVEASDEKDLKVIFIDDPRFKH